MTASAPALRRPSRGREAGLCVLTLLLLAVGFGGFLPVVAAGALLLVAWGRPLGVAAVLLLALALAGALAPARASRRGPTTAARSSAGSTVSAPVGPAIAPDSC